MQAANFSGNPPQININSNEEYTQTVVELRTTISIQEQSIHMNQAMQMMVVFRLM